MLASTYILPPKQMFLNTVSMMALSWQHCHNDLPSSVSGSSVSFSTCKIYANSFEGIWLQGHITHVLRFSQPNLLWQALKKDLLSHSDKWQLRTFTVYAFNDWSHLYTLVIYLTRFNLMVSDNLLFRQFRIDNFFILSNRFIWRGQEYRVL